jgi:hypothetical protein
MYEVIPLKAIGPILLGMSREESRSAMGIQPDTFRKADSATLTDAYDLQGFHVYFDEDERVEYIEIFPSRMPAMYKGVSVFETKADDLVAEISKDAQCDKDDPELGFSYVFPELELSLWRGMIPESEDDVEDDYFSSLGIGRKGYYSHDAV